MDFQRLRIAIVARNRCNVSDLRQAVRTRTYMLLSPIISHVPRCLEIRARPDSARGHTPKPALTLEEPCSSSCYSIALRGICCDSNCVAACFGGGKEGHRCVAWKRTPPMHSWTQLSTEATPASPVPLRMLQLCSSTRVLSWAWFWPQREKGWVQPLHFRSSHLCWVLQVQSNMEQNTVFLIKRKIHSWHCIRWVPKAFQG